MGDFMAAEIEDTYAEAFDGILSRVIVTADHKEVLERAKLRNKDGSSSIDIDKTVLSKSRKNNNLKGKDSNE